MSNSTSKMGENICSHLTTVDKNFVLHEVIVITAYYTLLFAQWKGKFQTQLTMTGFYRAVTTLHSCIAWWETRGTRDIKHLVYVRPFSLGISLHWERNRNNCLELTLFLWTTSQNISESLMQRESARSLLSSSNKPAKNMWPFCYELTCTSKILKASSFREELSRLVN